MSDEKPRNPVEKPKWVSSNRDLRGGFWNNPPYYLKFAYRYGSNPSYRSYTHYGFRIARTKK